MPLQNYINKALPAPLVTTVNSSAASFQVGSTAGYPTPPFKISIERGSANEEVCWVTSVDATHFSGLTRGYDNTTAITHTAGVLIEHVVSAEDYTLANRHVFDTTRDDHTQYARKDTVTTKGDIYVRDNVGLVRLGVGADNLALVADSTQTTGLKWDAVLRQALLTTKGDIYIRDATNVVRLAVGTNGQVIMADSAQAAGVRWDSLAAYLRGDVLTTKGDIYVRDASGVVRVGVGANGTALLADSAQASGVRWGTLTPGAADFVICTSSTRPTPRAGLTIFETDTFKTLQYTTFGTGWRPPWALPWGRVPNGHVVKTNAHSSIGTGWTDVSGLSVTYDLLAGRSYRVKVSCWTQTGTSAAFPQLAIRDSLNNAIALTYPSGTATVANSALPGEVEYSYNNNTTVAGWTHKASVFFNANGNNQAGVVSSGGGQNAWIRVEDTGPSANPS